MNRVSRSFVATVVVTCSLFMMGVSGCEQNQDILNWVESTSKLKTTADQQADAVPYRQDQFEALKAYFVELNRMVLALRDDAGLAQRFSSAFSQGNAASLCSRVFAPKDRWDLMVERCTRNNFFLCAEEVRAYPEMVAGLRGKLALDQQKRFDQTPACQAAPR